MHKWTIGSLKFVCFSFAFLFLITNISAQPDWVKNALKAELSQELKADAPAIVIHNFASSTISPNGSAISNFHKATKVLKPAGKDETHLFVHIDPLRSVKNLKGWHIESDGTLNGLKKEYVVVVGFAEAAGYYDDSKTLTAIFPDVESGDLVAFEYDVDEKPSWEGFYGQFIFQSDLPVVATAFELTIPVGWEIRTSGQHLDPVTASVEANKSKWTSNSLSYRAEEPYMPDWSSQSRRIQYSCFKQDEIESKGFNNWNDVSKWVRSIYDRDTGKDANLAELIARIKSESSTPHEKLLKVAKWIQDNIRYVAVELGLGRFQPRTPALTLSNKYGDCKDKSELMRAILAGLDIPSQPALAMIGEPVDENFPSPAQFNHVILAIPINNINSSPDFNNAAVAGWLYFDPTDPVTTVGNLPTNLHGTKVLNIAHSDSGLVQLPKLPAEQRHRKYFARVQLLGDYSLNAQIRISDYGNRAAESRLYWRSTSEKDQADWLKKYYSGHISKVILTEFERHDQNDSTWITFNLTGARYINESGELFLLKADLFHSDNLNSFTKPKRVHPITFGFPGITETNIEWLLPGELRLNGKLDTINYSFEDFAVESIAICDSRILRVHTLTRDGGREFSQSEYEHARNYEKNINTAYKRRILFSKE